MLQCEGIVMIWLREFFSCVAIMVAALLIASCNDREAQPDEPHMDVGAGIPVPAAGETEAVVTADEDAADDAEIWVDAQDPSRGLIFATDKKAGLYYYGLDGKVVGFIPDGRLNNVDLRADFPTAQGVRVLIVASDRGRKGTALYLLDPATLAVTSWTLLPSDLDEPYGICAGKRGENFIVALNDTAGRVRQFSVAAGPDGQAQATVERRFALSSQTEGCVIDDAKGWLYVGEEGKGIWRFALDPAQNDPGTLIAAAPSDMLKPDVEGLTLLREGPVTWLIASSQGDSAFAVWRADGDAPEYRGRFSVVAAGDIDAVTGTDGVAGLGGPVGPYPEGLLVMQDGLDTQAGQNGGPLRQNFKLVDWRSVKSALKLDDALSR